MSEVRDRWRRGIVRTQALVRIGSLAKRYWHELRNAGHSKPVVVVCIHKRTLYSASHDSTCRSWDLTTHACNGVFEYHTAEVRAMLVFTHDGRDYLVSGSADTVVCIWKDCDSSKRPMALKRHREGVHRLCRFDEWIFSGSHDKTIIQWRIEDGACLRVFDDHTAPVMGILVTESGLLVSCAGDCKLKVWSLYDVSSSNGSFDDLPVRTTACDTLSGHNAIVESLTHIEPDVVFSGDTKGRIIRWSLETKSAETEYHGHKSGISCLSVTIIPSEGSWEDTPVLISGSSDATIRIWDIDNGAPLKMLEVHSAGISCLRVYYTANYHCPLMFTGGSDNTIACCLLSPALDFPHLASYPGHKQAVRDVVLLDGDVLASVSADSDRPEGPILFSASDDATIRSYKLRLQHDPSSSGPDAGSAGQPFVHISGSSESSEAVDAGVHVAIASDASQVEQRPPPVTVTKPILEWRTGLVMNSASGTWPNNLQGLAKLIVDGVQLLGHPFAIIEANRWLHRVFLERTLVDYPAWLQKGEGVVSGLQLLTDPLDVIISIASSVMRLGEMEVGGGFQNVHPNLVRFWAAAAVVCLQAIFLCANTRTAILWKLRHHALDPTAGEKLKSVRRIPRVLCDIILLVVMWGPATVLFMPITEALLNAVSGELHETESLPYHAIIGSVLLGLYLLTVSRLTCLQGKIEYMDTSSVYFGNDSLEEAMQDSHMFSVRSIWYLRTLFVLQTFYLIVGVFANRLSPVLGLSLLLVIACMMFGLTCINPPYYHDSVNATFVVFTAIVMWSNVVSLLAALDPRAQLLDEPSEVHRWLPTWLPWEALLPLLICAALLVFHLVHRYVQGLDIFKWVRSVVKAPEDSTYFPLLSVLRVPNLEAVLAVLGQLAHETRGRAEREKLVRQGAIPAVVKCLDYLGKLRSAIATAEKRIKAVQKSSRLRQRLTKLYWTSRLYLLHGVRVEDKAAVFGASESAIRALGNLLINGMQTGALPQAKSVGAFSLFLAELYAAAKAAHKPECDHLNVLQTCRWANVGREVPFEPKLTQFATISIMNSAGPEALGAWLVSQGVVEIVHSILACAASQSAAARERNEPVEMAVTHETIDYVCRIMSQLGLSNKHDPDIKLKIIKTGITKPLMALASVPSTAPKPYSDWAFRAVLAIANLCDDTNDPEMRAQLSTRMVQEGVLDPLFLHLTSPREDLQLRALDGLCTISDTITLRSLLASHLADTAVKLARMLEVNDNVDVKNKVVLLLKSVFALDQMQDAPLAFHPRMLQDYASEEIRYLWRVAQSESAQPKMPARAYTMLPRLKAAAAGVIAIQRSTSTHSEAEPSLQLPPSTPSPFTNLDIGGAESGGLGGGSALVRTQRVSRPPSRPSDRFDSPRDAFSPASDLARSRTSAPAFRHFADVVRAVTPMRPEPAPAAMSSPVAAVMVQQQSEHQPPPPPQQPPVTATVSMEEVPAAIQEGDTASDHGAAELLPSENQPVAGKRKLQRSSDAADGQETVAPKRTRRQRNREQPSSQSQLGQADADSAPENRTAEEVEPRQTRGRSRLQKKRTFSERR